MSWINFPKIEGCSSRQAHVNLPENSYERELGRDGFYGPSTQMHHKHPPTDWVDIQGSLAPRAFDSTQLHDDWNQETKPETLFFNSVLRIRLIQLHQDMPTLYRNADGDELLFIHAGSGDCYCDYGHLNYTKGDYLLMPRGTLWRLETDTPTCILSIEASGESLKLPEKLLLGQQAIFDPAMLDTPNIDDAFLAQQHEEKTQVRIKYRNQYSQLIYPFNPLDAIGWHGTLMPVRINWRHIRPVISPRYHLPPSAHSTFISQNFIICTFVPRPSESAADALNLPFFHSNEDYDELIFYHHGQFFSRDHIKPGMFTLHPGGLPHGPHPKALRQAANNKGKLLDEVAVMIDSRPSIQISAQAESIEWLNYKDSWQ